MSVPQVFEECYATQPDHSCNPPPPQIPLINRQEKHHATPNQIIQFTLGQSNWDGPFYVTYT